MSVYLCVNDGNNIVKCLAASSTNSTENYLRVDSYYFPLTTDTTAEQLLKIKGAGTSTFRMQRIHTITTTTGTSYLTTQSTSGTSYLTQQSTYSTTYKTQQSTSNTTYLTQKSTYSTTYRTRSSTSGTGYLTRSSTSTTYYGTRTVYNDKNLASATFWLTYAQNTTKRQQVSVRFSNNSRDVQLAREGTGDLLTYYSVDTSFSNSTNSRIYWIYIENNKSTLLINSFGNYGVLSTDGFKIASISDQYLPYGDFLRGRTVVASAAKGTVVSTTGVTYSTRSSRYSTTYATRMSTSATDYLTRSSTYSTSYLTRSSTYSTDYLTRSSTYSTSYLTRSSTSSTSYLTTTTTSQW